MEFRTRFWILLLISAFIEVESQRLFPQHALISCDEGWYKFRNKCYKVFGLTEKGSWQGASRGCDSLGGNLVTIYSRELQDYLAAFLLLNVQSSVWIGLRPRNPYHRTVSQYMWDDGSKCNYTNWDLGEPSNSYNENCVEMNFWSPEKIGMWNNIPCHRSLPFICEKHLNELKHVPDPKFCYSDKDTGLKYLDSCYHTVHELKTCYEAEEYCQTKLKGHLVTILNSREDFFVNYLVSQTPDKFWIGMRTNYDKIVSQWSSGWYVKYAGRLYNNGMTSRCALLESGKRWKLDSCYNKLPFICMTSKEDPLAIKESPKDSYCPSSIWKHVAGELCYYVENEKPRSWHDANFDCILKGGTLAIIRSAAEMNAIYHLILLSQRKSYKRHETYSIGLRRSLNNENSFQWIDTSYMNYERWEAGEIFNKTGNCVAIQTDTVRWRTIPCSTQTGYVCSVRKSDAIRNAGMIFLVCAMFFLFFVI